jgi:phosphate transport system substrate-binding protein
LHLKKLTCVAAAALATTGTSVFAATADAAAPTLNGAGSTLVAPLEGEWAAGWGTATGGDQVVYQAVGSGTGIKDITSRTVDFGASDAPMTPTQQSGCNAGGGTCLTIPWALSATGVGFNVPGVRSLKLSGPVLADIYLGRITNWDSSAIKRLNHGERLPSLAITPIYRSDSSGDSYAFSNYLAHVSGAAKSTLGVSTQPAFGHGVGAAKNTGMVSTLEATKGGIGYIAVSYLIANKLKAAAIENAAGSYEYPNLREIENAASIVKHASPDSAISIVDPPKQAKIAYPIATFTNVIVPSNAKQGALLKSFIDYALKQGQSDGPRLDFAALPRVVKSAALTTVGEIH